MESLAYGSRTSGMPKVAEEVERYLNVKLELHESSFLGGDYWTVTTELEEEIEVAA